MDVQLSWLSKKIHKRYLLPRQRYRWKAEHIYIARFSKEEDIPDQMYEASQIIASYLEYFWVPMQCATNLQKSQTNSFEKPTMHSVHTPHNLNKAQTSADEEQTFNKAQTKIMNCNFLNSQQGSRNVFWLICPGYHRGQPNQTKWSLARSQTQ